VHLWPIFVAPCNARQAHLHVVRQVAQKSRLWKEILQVIESFFRGGVIEVLLKLARASSRFTIC
jgi:hypothetical protein